MEGPQSTDPLISILAARDTARLQTILLEVVAPFPVAGRATWANDWHVYRACPYPHLHEGVDLLAPRGTPVVATADGAVTTVANNPISGLAVTIEDARGTSFFYAHLSSLGRGVVAGLKVHLGDVLGFIGNSGDAAGGPTHLHFQVEPGGVPVPPKPFVDSWLLQAERRARALLASRPMDSELDSPRAALALANGTEPGLVDVAAPRERGLRVSMRPDADPGATIATGVAAAAMLGGVVVWMGRRRRGGNSHIRTLTSVADPPSRGG